MLNSDLIPQSKQLKKLGFRLKRKTPTQRFFEARKDCSPIKPDVDYYPEPGREPQDPKYTAMWIDHFSHYGDIKNPLGSPME